MADMTQGQKSAYDLMLGILSSYGLASLAPTLARLVQEETDQDVLLYRLRETPEYRDRFPAMDALRQKGIPFTEGDYFNYEVRARQLESQYDLPSGFLTSKERIASLLTNDVDAEDLSRRVALNYASSLNAPQEVKDSLQRLYGIGQGGVAAFYLDPDNAAAYLEKVAASTTIAAEGQRQGFTIDREQAERFASLGYQQNQARAAFEQAAEWSGLTAGDYGVSSADLVGATFGEGDAAKRVEQAQKTRTGQFKGTGGADVQAAGVSGLGSAGTT
jgi:hypothetical protein